MKGRYLEITYRKGKLIAAYLYLPTRLARKSKKTSKAADGILVDYNKAGKPIGVEIIAPEQVSWQMINQVVVGLNLPPVSEAELTPLRAV